MSSHFLDHPTGVMMIEVISDHISINLKEYEKGNDIKCVKVQTS